MNKRINPLALFSMLSLIAASCQKEEVVDYVPTTLISEAETMYTVQYTIDGVLYQATPHNKAERTEFFRQLFAMAKNGHEVFFYDGNRTDQCVATKDVVHYSTTNEDEAIAWAEKMYDNGYKVSIQYDKEKKVYICIAIRE